MVIFIRFSGVRFWTRIKAAFFICLGKMLFGDTYSGLEFDYTGLVHCYARMGEVAKVDRYSAELHRWRLIKDEMASRSFIVLLFYVPI